MLGCFGPEEEDSTEIRSIPQIPGVSWNTGERVSVPIPLPLRVELDEQHPGVLLPMYHKGILVFSDAMIDSLRKAGVDNLEVFPLAMFDPFENITRTEYKVVNIVGAIAAADLSQSKYVAHGTPLIDVEFDSLTIDPKKAGGALMFRLAENVAGIVIHDRVRQQLLQDRIPYLDFDAPADWLG